MPRMVMGACRPELIWHNTIADLRATARVNQRQKQPRVLNAVSRSGRISVDALTAFGRALGRGLGRKC